MEFSEFFSPDDCETYISFSSINLFPSKNLFISKTNGFSFASSSSSSLFDSQKFAYFPTSVSNFVNYTNPSGKSDKIFRLNDPQLKDDCYFSQFSLYMHNFDALCQLTVLLHGKLKIEQGYHSKLITKLISNEKSLPFVIEFIDKIFNEKKLLFKLCKEMYDFLHNLTLKLSLRRNQLSNPFHHQFIKEMTIKGLEPKVEKLIKTHNEQIKDLKSLQELELIDIRVRLRNTFDEEIIALRDKYHAEFLIAREKIKVETMSFLHKQVKLRENVLDQRRNSISFLFKQGITSVIHELNLLNSGITTVKENFVREKNDFIVEMGDFRNKIFQEIHNSKTKEVARLNEYWQREMSTGKIHFEKLCRNDFEKKEKTIIEKCKKENDENIEILISNLEGKFNDIRFSESVQQNENNGLLKINYERQLSDLMLRNKRIEAEYSDLCAKYGNLENEFILFEDDKISNSTVLTFPSIQTGESLEPEAITLLPKKQCMTTFSTVYLENKHLKNYIRELELRMKHD